ncbi:MAG: protein kinase [Elusimicrobia bacterium]|nr:protein kinase [Elusimicrobiota bacterium]
MLRLCASIGFHFRSRNDHPPTWSLKEGEAQGGHVLGGQSFSSPGEGGGGQRVLPVSLTPFQIGRAHDCQLVLPDSPEYRHTTSRWHCHIIEEDGNFWVVDGGARELPEFGGSRPSGTGTFLNGRKIFMPERLKSGDALRVGPWEFGVELGAQKPVDIDGVLSKVCREQPLSLPSDDPKVRGGYARLQELFERIHRGESVEDSLIQILEFAVANIAGAQVVAIILQESGGEQRVRIAWQRGVGRILDLRFSSGLLSRMSSQQAFLLKPNVGKAGGDMTRSQQEEDISSGLLVPIRRGPRLTGALYMDNRGRGEAFSEADLYLANALAGAVSLQLSLERQALLSAVEQNMRRYFGPDVVRMIIDESRAGKRIGLGVRECHATIVFIDMQNFSSFSRRHTPQEIADLLNPYFELMTRCIQAHGGHVDKFIGDAVMGVFGAQPLEDAPRAENPAAQAVRSALMMIREWSKGSASPWGREIPIRVGINSGKVVAGNIGSPGRMEYSVLGDAVNLAARMEKLARPNAVALTEAAYELVRDDFECEEGGKAEVKGFGAVPVWHLKMEAEQASKAEFQRWEKGRVVEGIYEVKGLLGVGGMGSVYRVRHKAWNLDMAVKRPTSQLIAGIGGAERFVREAETWVNLPMHPNIVTAYYVRAIGGAPAIFAECVEGGDLLGWIQEGRIQDPAHALDAAIQICWGMAVAHGKGLVHRDLKPANVLMSASGEPKVTDFGLVSSAGRQDPRLGVEYAPPAAGEEKLTGSGAQVGTPGYMPPEQWTSLSAGPAADIYSFGAMLFELLCSRLPFELQPDFEYADRSLKRAEFKRMHLHDEPPDPKSLNPDIPDALAALILSCLSKDPGARPPSFVDISRSLISFYREVSGQEYGRKNPGELESRASELNNRALSMLDLGKKEDAKRLLEDALKADPHHVEAAYNQALLFWNDALIDDVQAVKRMEEALKAHPFSGMGEVLLGLMHLRRADAQAAEECLLRAVKLPGAGAGAYAALGDSRMALGRFAEAEASYVKALNLAPGALENKRRLAAALLRQDRRPEAVKLWGDEKVEEAVKGLCFAHMGCLRVFEGHQGYVETVAVTPDGRAALTGSLDKTLRLWDLSTGECVHILAGIENTPFIVVSPDGRFALVRESEGAISFWDLASAKFARKLESPSGSVHSLALTSDGRRAVSGGDDGTLVSWDLENGKHLKKFDAHKGVVYSVAIAANGRQALSGGGDGALRLWDLDTGVCVRAFEGHQQAVVSVAMAPGGRLAVSGSWDDTLRIWDLASGKCLRRLEGHSTVTSVAISPDKRLILSGGLDRTMRLWELQTGRCVRAFKDLPGSVYAVAFAPEGRALSAGSDKAMRLWNISETLPPLPPAFAQFMRSEEAAMLQQRVASIRAQVVREAESGRFAQAGRRLSEARAIPGYDQDPGLLALSDRLARKGRRKGFTSSWVQRTLRGHSGPVSSVAISPDERHILSASADKTMRLWNLATGQCLCVFEGHAGPVSSAAVSPDGRHGLSAGEDKTLRLWDLATGKFSRAFEGHSDRVNCAAFTPNARHAVSGSEDRTLRLWSVETGRCLRALKGHHGGIKSVCLSADGLYAVSAGDDNALFLWDISTGERVRSFTGHEYSVYCAALSSDCRRLLSGSGDETLRVWEVSTGRCLRVRGERAAVSFAQISPDGRYALSGVRGATSFKLWDMEAESPAAEFDGHSKPASCCAVSQSGRYAVSGGEDAAAQIWRLDWDYEFPDFSALDDRLRPHLELFLASRQGRWAEKDWEGLLGTLELRGLGWKKPEAIRRQLELLSQKYPAESGQWLKARYGLE